MKSQQQYYAEVENEIIELFGDFDKTAAYFDKNPISLSGLYAFCDDFRAAGYSADKTAADWYSLNVVRKKLAKTTTKKLTKVTTVYRGPVIEPEVLKARESRRGRWLAERVKCCA